MRKPRHKAPSAAPRAHSASAAAEGERPDKGRWSSRRKTKVVLRRFRGEALDALSRELGVTPGKFAGSFLALVRLAFIQRHPEPLDPSDRT